MYDKHISQTKTYETTKVAIAFCLAWKAENRATEAGCIPAGYINMVGPCQKGMRREQYIVRYTASTRSDLLNGRYETQWCRLAHKKIKKSIGLAWLQRYDTHVHFEISRHCLLWKSEIDRRVLYIYVYSHLYCTKLASIWNPVHLHFPKSALSAPYFCIPAFGISYTEAAKLNYLANNLILHFAHQII